MSHSESAEFIGAIPQLSDDFSPEEKATWQAGYACGYSVALKDLSDKLNDILAKEGIAINVTGYLDTVS